MWLQIATVTHMNPFHNSDSNVFFDPLHDIHEFHRKFGLEQSNEKVAVAPAFSPDFTLSEEEQFVREHRDKMTAEEWELRHRRLIDEAMEYQGAVEEKDDEETLDALVDIVYIALGTAYRRGWDFAEAWNRVHNANMAKERGEPNNSKYGSGFDIVKPKGWEGPNHKDLV